MERNLPRAASLMRGDVLGEPIRVQEGGDGHSFLGLLVDHQRHADAAVRVASAGELAPVVRPVRGPGRPSRRRWT